MKIKITSKMLENLNACAFGIEDFIKVFPDGAQICELDARKAVSAGLDVEFFAEHFLSDKDQEAIENAADTTYDEQRDERDFLEEEHSRIVGPFYDQYHKTTKEAYRVFSKAKWSDEAMKEYDKVVDAAGKAFDQGCGEFVENYQSKLSVLNAVAPKARQDKFIQICKRIEVEDYYEDTEGKKTWEEGMNF